MSWFNRKTSKRKKQRFTAERLIFWFKRFGISLAVLTFILWLGAWFFLSGSSTVLKNWTEEKLISASASMGFEVENILVEGRYYTDGELLLTLLNVEKGEALFNLNITEAKKQIENISWVKNVVIERRFPDTIYLKLEERVPLALLQKDGKLSLIDEEGIFLTDKNLGKFSDLVIVTGEDVEKQVGAFLKLLEAEPLLRNKVEAVQYVSQRRWNVKLKNGLLIKLPEEDLPLIMAQLAKHQEKDGLLDKDIKSIDVRTFPRIIVQTHPGAAYSYEAQYSAKENTI